eukprot:TRINITY_DN4856_c0_g1_i1.p1 TRINITY_DN4856_c0_g1~~TRINITY_DN4856_c0_g1_i1.p1  ORF type:complete len:244 (-),score=46.07 TRINITY_DN4856_c0_g1_i1:1104-1835(-)
MEGARRRKERLGWVEETAKDELVRNFLGTRCFCFSKQRKQSVWVVDKSHWRKCRDHWLLGHILAFSTRSLSDGKMIGSLEKDEFERLKREARTAENECLGERRCAFFALGLLMSIEGGDLSGRLLRSMRKIGEGGMTAKALKKFVHLSTMVEGDKCGGITEWYCKGSEVWISEVAARRAGKEARFDDECSGRWFLRLDGEEISGDEETEEGKGRTDYYLPVEYEDDLSEEEKDDLHDLILRDW